MAGGTSTARRAKSGRRHSRTPQAVNRQKKGKATTELALAFGADDIDGTIDDTTKIYSMAGADDRRPRMTADEMRTIVRHAGLRAVERDTLYNEL